MSMLTGGLDARMPQYQTSVLDDSWFLRASKPSMSYRKRGDSRFGSGYNWLTLWPPSGFLSGDRSAGYCPMGQDGADSDAWSPWQRASRGNGATKFILGQCKDSVGVAVGGAVVQCFRTSDDLLVSETAADDKGNYEAATVYPYVGHYLVAYRAGAPDIAGTTVNTLLGTNRDGT